MMLLADFPEMTIAVAPRALNEATGLATGIVLLKDDGGGNH